MPFDAVRGLRAHNDFLRNFVVASTICDLGAASGTNDGFVLGRSVNRLGPTGHGCRLRCLVHNKHTWALQTMAVLILDQTTRIFSSISFFDELV